MNESVDQKNTDTSVQPEEKTLYQQKLEKERSNSISIRKGGGILVGLSLLLVIVIFVLPLLVQEDKEDLPIQTIEEETILILNQEILAQKPIAEALLSELLIKIESLKLQGILFWGMEKWENVLIIQQEGDSAFIEQQYDVSAERYRDCLLYTSPSPRDA